MKLRWAYLLFSTAVLLTLIGCSRSKKEGSPQPYHQELNSSFSKDSSTVFYDGNVISNADALSFVALDKHYGKDRDHVFFCDWHIEGQSIFTLGKKETITEVAGAFPKTFVSLGFMYAKDSLHAYFKGNKIRVKHLATFRALDLDFSADTLQAYFNLRPIIGSDGATFQMVDECFARDKKFVYFSFYDQEANEKFIKIITGAKPGSFKPVDGWFSKDASSAFFRDRKINGADPLTFEPVGNWNENRFSKDVYAVFFETDKLEGADQATFAVCPKGENAFKLFYFGRDKNSVFWKTKKVEGADAATFIILGMGYGKDKQHIFCGTEMVKDADPQTFQIRPTDGEYSDAQDATSRFSKGKRIKEE